MYVHVADDLTARLEAQRQGVATLPQRVLRGNSMRDRHTDAGAAVTSCEARPHAACGNTRVPMHMTIWQRVWSRDVKAWPRCLSGSCEATACVTDTQTLVLQ